MRKRAVSFLLAMILFIGFIPTIAYAQDVYEEDGYSFNTETGELYIKNDAGSTLWRNDPNIAKEDVKSVTFQRLDTPVLNLGESAFEGCINLEGVVKLNADATSIGANAFKGCDKIDLILIPEGAKADIEAAGISEETAYIVYQFDKDADSANGFFVRDVHYGSMTQIVFDGNIYDGTWSCGVDLICEDKFNVVPASGKTAWYYHTEADGQITVTKYVTNPDYSQTITLSKNFGDLVVKQYAEGAFSSSGLTAETIIVVDEEIQATIPEEVSKMVIKTENGSKVAYLTEGTSGSIDQSLHFLNVPRDVNTLFMKDIMASSYNLMLMECNAVSYTEDAGGKIVITNILCGMFGESQGYTVPSTIDDKPVTTVMINRGSSNPSEITVDESMNKIIYECDFSSDSGTCTITQIVQGDQTSVEIPAEIGGRPIGSIPETVFDESVESIVVPEGLEVAQPEDVCKIEYTIDSDGKVLVTDIVPGKDENGEIKPVVVPGSIAGQAPAFSDEVKEEIGPIPHEHTGGTATCTERAECQLCGQPYGEIDETNHAMVHVAHKEPTCTAAGNSEYWICEDCEKVFKDAEGNAEITLAETVLAPKGHDYEGGRCTACGAIDLQFTASITAGANSTWNESDKTGLSFTSNAAFADFIKVQVDGKDVDPSNYTVREGSTIVTLKAEYLKTLSNGKHVLAIVSKTGTATAEFMVEAEIQSPQTGENDTITMWISLMFGSAGLLSAMVVSNKKRTAKNG